MTQWFSARARQSDGRFDFTVATSSSEPTPLGYCRGWREDTLEGLEPRFGHDLAKAIIDDQEHLRPHMAKFHTDGHATEAEASACYDEFCLDTALKFTEDNRTQHRCTTCDEWTTWFGVLAIEPTVRRPLCQRHHTRADMTAAIAKR